MDTITYLLHHDRSILPKLMPRNAVVAEIGVAEGEYSEAIIEHAQPREFHLIDPWSHQDDPDYLVDPNNTSDEVGDSRYAAVCEKFSRQRNSSQVTVHRAFSPAIAEDFRPLYFDWVYVDAMHTKEAVTSDLEAWFERVGPDGFICGHDYANHAPAARMNFGVIEAVNEFVKKYHCRLLAITIDDPWPSYIISKQVESDATTNVENLILTNLNFIRVKNFTERGYKLKIVNDSEGKAIRSIVELD